MPLYIREAKIEDLEAIYAIEKECFTLDAFSKKQLATLLQDPSSVSLAGRTDGEIVGFIIALIHEKENTRAGHIFTLDVATRARQKGVGQKLLKAAERILRKKGVKMIYLEVNVDNVAARELYAKHGYVVTELLKDFYYSGDGIRMKKELTGK